MQTPAQDERARAFIYLNPVNSWNLCLLCCCCFLMSAHLPWGQWDEGIVPNLQKSFILITQWMVKWSIRVRTYSNTDSTTSFTLVSVKLTVLPECRAFGPSILQVETSGELLSSIFGVLPYDKSLFYPRYLSPTPFAIACFISKTGWTLSTHTQRDGITCQTLASHWTTW